MNERPANEVLATPAA